MKSLRSIQCYAVLVLVIVSGGLFAQPAGNSVLTNARAVQLKHCTRLTVSFSFPFRYLTHVPEKKGRELRIQLAPIAVSRVDREAVKSNESIRIMDNNIKVKIKGIDYEGQYSLNRPFLIIAFDSVVYYKVVPGKDFRSIVVYMDNDAFDSCE